MLIDTPLSMCTLEILDEVDIFVLSASE